MNLIVPKKIFFLIRLEVFGKVLAIMSVVEFQKRGLPHAHILLILSSDVSAFISNQLDSIVTAEIPSVDGDTPDRRERQSKLLTLVQTHMMHGPCGSLNDKSPCMSNGKCTKKYPKKFQQQSSCLAETGYPMYRRRSPENGGHVVSVKGHTLDNRFVVPYNAFLLLKYQCHLNVEVCANALAAKYLCLYITKVRCQN